MRKSALSLCFVALLLLCSGSVLAEDRASSGGAGGPSADVVRALLVRSGHNPLVGLLDGALFTSRLARAGVPPEFGWYTYKAAVAIDIDPYDLGALLISEHSSYRFDFTFAKMPEYDRPITYEADATGSGGERGLFQQKPDWIYSARTFYGTDWEPDDLYDPWVNTQVAAFQVKHAIESHEKCAGQLHDWMAHWKCGPKARNSYKGQCGFAQRKMLKVKASLRDPYISPEDLKAVGKERYVYFDGKAKALAKHAARKKRRSLRKDLMEAYDRNEVPYEEAALREWSIEELQRELDFLEVHGEGGQ